MNGFSENTRAVMGNEKEKGVCKSQPEQLELIRRWRDALDGSNKEIAFDLLDQVMEGKITNEAAFAALNYSERLTV
jgi:hypothetical protein